MNIEVTTLAKKEQKLSHAAAAVYVITQEEIRRSGATSIPEVLRMAPGVQVARIDANKWAITARGFNGRFANKMLVLVDGRSVYTPLFSGVFWDSRDTLLEDIERIEVIRGPGATMWGANAVNGVINIITRNASDTPGVLLAGGAGNEEQGFGAFRFGAALNPKVFYRVYSRYFSRNHMHDEAGHDAPDGWDFARGGFRMDAAISPKDSLTVQGDMATGREGQRLSLATLSPPYRVEPADAIDAGGGFLLGRWTRQSSPRSQKQLQLYYDRSTRTEAVLGEVRDTVDIDFQHRIDIAERHQFLWGLSERLTTDRTMRSFSVSFTPQRRRDPLESAFLQGEIQLVRDRLWLTVGSKFEHNNYTGFEVQPDARLLWTPSTRHSGWLSASRAVRPPSRGDHDARVNVAVTAAAGGRPATLVSVFGSRELQPEELLAYEFGYRAQPRGRFSIDLAGFYNRYHHLRTAEPGIPFLEGDPQPAHVVFPLVLANQMNGHTYGLETSVNWRASRHWKLAGNYTWLRIRLHPLASSQDSAARSPEGESPRHQSALSSYLDLPGNLQLDTGFQYVGSLARDNIPAYLRLDVRLGWMRWNNLELSVGAQNVLDRQHVEFAPEAFGTRTRIGRNLYGKVTFRF